LLARLLAEKIKELASGGADYEEISRVEKAGVEGIKAAREAEAERTEIELGNIAKQNSQSTLGEQSGCPSRTVGGATTTINGTDDQSTDGGNSVTEWIQRMKKQPRLDIKATGLTQSTLPPLGSSKLAVRGLTKDGKLKTEIGEAPRKRLVESLNNYRTITKTSVASRRAEKLRGLGGGGGGGGGGGSRLNKK